MIPVNPNESFWKGKHVFLTGHTGFKGGWLSLWLSSMGANVSGFSLAPNTTPNFFELVGLENMLFSSEIGDIRDQALLLKAVKKANPDIIFHLAAQPLVRYSYDNPIETYATNVMGTAHLLEGIKSLTKKTSTVIVTSDKCYENKEWEWGYRENEPMGGWDPYSSSKGCAELVTSAYRRSFFLKQESSLRGFIATARAGNVIGGGDWSQDRLVPDIFRSIDAGSELIIRNPDAIRPWQHVLEPLAGYILLAESLYEQGSKFEEGWNFGPDNNDARSVEDLINLFKFTYGDRLIYRSLNHGSMHEAGILKLDCSKAIKKLNWIPRWNLESAIKKTIDWHTAYIEGISMSKFSLDQIKQYLQNLK